MSTTKTDFFSPTLADFVLWVAFIAIVLVLLWLFKKWWKH